MKFLKLFLLPFSWLYALVTYLRNICYDKSIFKSKSYQIPIIAVGNLSVGGTGKTPMIEYLIRLLQDNYKLATLSRGYKRKSKGYLLADEQSTAQSIGDEPFQYFTKFENIQVAVSESRQIGIENLLKNQDPPEIILLDDAFQHRLVKAGFYILLTSFDKIYTDDFVLPFGRLRESQSGAKRANIIVVTKCPLDLSEEKQHEIIKKIKPQSNQQVFFSGIFYSEFVFSRENSVLLSTFNQPKLIVVGIAKPQPFIDFVKNEKDEIIIFPDHHHFNEKDIKQIKERAGSIPILTTEKDFMRLSSHFEENLFYLPMTSNFLKKGEDFNDLIKNYVRTNNRNS